MAYSAAAAPLRRRPAPRPRPVPAPAFAEATQLLRAAALARAVDEPDAARRIAPLLQRRGLPPSTVDLAAEAAVRDITHTLLTHGWTPLELHAFAAKRLDADGIAYLVDALAEAAQWSAHGPWLSDLAELRAHVWWTRGRPHLAQWAARHARPRPEALAVVVRVLALLAFLPRTDAVQPGAPTRPALVPGALVHDTRIVGKIDALLTRASGTGYPDEASACAGKAQELMLRYATVPPTASVLARGTRLDPRRIAASVAAELAGLARRARSGFGARVRPPRAITGRPRS